MEIYNTPRRRAESPAAATDSERHLSAAIHGAVEELVGPELSRLADQAKSLADAWAAEDEADATPEDLPEVEVEVVEVVGEDRPLKHATTRRGPYITRTPATADSLPLSDKRPLILPPRPDFVAAHRAARGEVVRHAGKRWASRLVGLVMVAVGVAILVGCASGGPGAMYAPNAGPDLSATLVGSGTGYQPYAQASRPTYRPTPRASEEPEPPPIASVIPPRSEDAGLRPDQVAEMTPAPEGASMEGTALSATPTPEPVIHRHPAIEEADELLDAGRKAEARRVLSQALLTDLSATDEQTVLDRLNGINRDLLTDTSPEGDCTLYVVQRGDTLSEIAEDYGTTWKSIQKLNRLRGTEIHPGQRLRILRGTPRLVVNRQRYALDLWLGDHFVKRYVVGIGPGDETPPGTYRVSNKLENPSWRGIPSGDPRNPLGTRWLGIGQGLGIHGTDDPATLGTDSTNGCIRLATAAVEEIYDIITLGTEVTIR